MKTASDVLRFWFEDHSMEDWFTKSDVFDDKIRKQFSDTHKRAAKGELYGWRASAEGRTAEILVLDQFSRQLFRDSGQAFAYDLAALTLAQELVASGKDKSLPPNYRWFSYLPYMHSESLEIHNVAVDLFTELGLEDVLEYEYKHKDIIERFGRYPHRNKVLGRKSTDDEIEFLKQPGSSF